MEKLYKAVSIALHPVFLPSIGTVIYLLYLPLPLSSAQKYIVFFIMLGGTFLVPLISLFFLKLLGVVKSNQVKTIQERKIPVILMVVNYLFLAIILKDIWQLRELVILTYATAVSLVITTILFYAKTKVSLHMIGISGLLGFFIVYGFAYHYLIFLIALLVGLTGLLATARLQLKAHSLKEIILGTCLGLFVPMLLSSFL